MERQTTFTKEQLEENQSAFKNLIEFIQSGDAILMAGAGCSGALYPPWRAFIKKLEMSALQHKPDFEGDKTNVLMFADKVKECLGDARYYSLIRNTFKPGEPTHLPYHETLCRLPFKTITTTNYDIVLENALTVVTKKLNNSLHFEGTAKNEILDFLQSLNFNKFSKKWIVHLHGVFNIPDSIVLSSSEYSSKYGFELGENSSTLFEQLQEGHLSKERLNNLLLQFGYEWPLRRKLMWSLLATRKIVFIGFSMSDPYFIKMLEFVKDDLSTYNAETHFLVLRVTPSSLKENIEFADYLKREYGIQTVFYQDEENKYSGISSFISDLEHQVNNLVKKSSQVQEAHAVQEIVTVQGDADLTAKLFALSKKQYTDES